MKKSSFVTLILGTIGGVFFALGMCMATIPEWDMFNPGVICGVAGLVILLCQRQSEIVRKRRRNFVVFRRQGGE